MPNDELLDLAGVCSLTGLTRSTIDYYRFPGKRRPAAPFPTPATYYGASPVWRAADVAAWNDKRRRVGRPPTGKRRRTAS